MNRLNNLPSLDSLDNNPKDAFKRFPTLDDFRTIAALLKKGIPPKQILNSRMGKILSLSFEDIESANSMEKHGLLAESKKCAEY